MNLLRTLSRQILFVLGWLALSGVAVATESVTYYHNDVAGTPVLATDAGGNLLWKETYLPYGKKQTNAVASGENRIGFTGKPYDNATGLSYLGARYYDPLIGRFNGIDPNGFDPANLQSFNRYAYANNNPYKFVDPDGRESKEVKPKIPVQTIVPTQGGASSNRIASNDLKPVSPAAGIASMAAAMRENKNSNTAVGNFGIYEIRVGGELHKIGKADLDRVTQSTGLPTRLHQQDRKLAEEHGRKNVESGVVEQGFGTTADAKAAETARLQKHFEGTNTVPPGNSRSFTPSE